VGGVRPVDHLRPGIAVTVVEPVVRAKLIVLACTVVQMLLTRRSQA
jgi:hypothetical protein